MSKVKLVFLVLSGLLLMTSAGLKSQVLVIQMKDGTENQEQLVSIQKLSFAAPDLLVSLTNGTVNPYGLSEIQKLYFATSTSVNENLSSEFSTLHLFPNPATGTLTISGMPVEAGYILVIRPDGKIMMQETVLSAQMTMEVSWLAPGMYFILAKGTSSKFIKL